MSVRRNVSDSGSGKTLRRTRKRRASCAHRWLLENTKYRVVAGSGQINLGRTRGRCKLCGNTRLWKSPTPDSIHGMESLIASNIRQEEGTLPEGFQFEDEENYDV